MTHRDSRLHIVVDETLRPGQQIAQVAHAVAEFALSHTDIAHAWNRESNYIIALAAARSDIETWRDTEDGIAFHEPDFDDAVTAFAFFPKHGISEKLAHLPLAGRVESVLR